VGGEEDHRGARSGKQRGRRREGNTGSSRGEAEEVRAAADLHRRRRREEGGEEAAGKERGALGFWGRCSGITLGLPGLSRPAVLGPAHVPDRAAA
jgi:hypothetical protein